MTHPDDLRAEVSKRRTFAIISHPDAGKTTVTEKLLLHGNVIQTAGTIKAKKSGRHAVSDWMTLEKERGISVTTSVMQFHFMNAVVNLLDTPGHEDFSEDTYRTLTAVDAALMVIDGVKGVEARTVKLLEVCRMRATPVWTFINKLDREIKEPVALLDEIEQKLDIACTPATWPIGAGQSFRGIYHLQEDCCYLITDDAAASVKGGYLREPKRIQGLASHAVKQALGEQWQPLADEIELLCGAGHAFDLEACLRGELTAVYFGAALSGWGVGELLRDFVRQAPAPQGRATQSREVLPTEDKFSGFIFKIQANMNPRHHDRIAFMRVCSGCYRPGMKIRQTRSGVFAKVTDAVSFMAANRRQADHAYPGDIIGLYSHGGIQIGDTYTEGEDLKFRDIPCFAPMLFKTMRLQNPLKSKQLEKGVQQLAEEGAAQFFKPLLSNELILGAIGVLQFDVVAFRLKEEYGVDCVYSAAAIYTARWPVGDQATLAELQRQVKQHCALDGAGRLAYLAPSRVNLQLAEEKWTSVEFHATREH